MNETTTKMLLASGTATFLGHHDYPGYYATVDGRVFSARSGRFLKPIKMGAYTGLTVRHANGKLVRRYLHRMLLEIVTGYLGDEVRHLDGDKSNNSLSNLAWGTRRENEADKRRHGTTPVGERNPMARLSWSDVRAIRRAAQLGTRQAALARDFNVSPMTISRVVRCESWIEAHA